MTPEQIEQAIDNVEKRFQGHDPKDIWPKYVSGGEYPPEKALDDLFKWIRTDHMEAYSGFRARVNVAAEDAIPYLLTQFLKLSPELKDSIFKTLPGNKERSALREDLIRHWAKLF